jgi:hypothetical protein
MRHLLSAFHWGFPPQEKHSFDFWAKLDNHNFSLVFAYKERTKQAIVHLRLLRENAMAQILCNFPAVQRPCFALTRRFFGLRREEGSPTGDSNKNGDLLPSTSLTLDRQKRFCFTWPSLRMFLGVP